MGYSYDYAIAQAAKYLLDLLKDRQSVPYSFFYDGTDERHEQLCVDVGADARHDCPEHLIDLAVAQLEKQGVVVCEESEQLLADGEKDYLIKRVEDRHPVDFAKLQFVTAE